MVQAPGQPAVAIPSSAWRLRSDAWEFLGYAARQLASTDPGSEANRLRAQAARLLGMLEPLESYWAQPGRGHVLQLRRRMDARDYTGSLALIEPVVRQLAPAAQQAGEANAGPCHGHPAGELPGGPAPAGSRPRFEVLVVDDISTDDQDALRSELAGWRRDADAFIYEVAVAATFEDAIVAVLLNPGIQACVLRPGFGTRSTAPLGRDLGSFLGGFIGPDGGHLRPTGRILALAQKLAELRPELDLYLVAGVSTEELAGSLTRRFTRIFRRQDSLELHLSLLRGIAARYETPFFTALQEHSQKPASVFHALPVSRGGSVVNSPWIKDMGEFYGLNLLMAETSATSGGLDSLLDPHGSIKRAQTLAARAFGAGKTFFVTNGTSTANKIVHQAVVAPGDVVLVDRNCHKSHHYALVLAGAQAAYLDAYPLHDYSFYGAVPLAGLKAMLLDYRKAGRLDQVKMVALTNCTFDGIVYDVERVMEECLAIKPDLVFLWDEAWFAFAGFHHVYRRRTAMAAARALEEKFRDPDYAREHAAQVSNLIDPATGRPAPDEVWLRTRLIPDPAAARLRVYATQSTHKTLTSLRQGSMIHVHDQDYSQLSEEAFREAYMTHTSTSPNYQILASLDIGRRQVELEGYELVQRQADLAVSVARAVARKPVLRKYFRVLDTRDLVPPQFRDTERPMPLGDGLADMDRAWRTDEFVVDPSRLTLHIGLSGIDGDTFKHRFLMDGHGIQVNKTSRNSVLFMTNIGTSRSSVAYLIEVLVKIAEGFDDDLAAVGRQGRQARAARVQALTGSPPPLPDFSRFADRFRHGPDTPDGNLRAAYYESYQPGSTEYLQPGDLARRVAQGRETVSADFLTPYPPGFPVLVPGQVITTGILDFMSALDTREIHGYNAELGYRVLTGTVQARQPPPRTAGARAPGHTSGTRAGGQRQ